MERADPWALSDFFLFSEIFNLSLFSKYISNNDYDFPSVIRMIYHNLPRKRKFAHLGGRVQWLGKNVDFRFNLWIGSSIRPALKSKFTRLSQRKQYPTIQIMTFPKLPPFWGTWPDFAETSKPIKLLKTTENDDKFQ